MIRGIDLIKGRGPIKEEVDLGMDTLDEVRICKDKGGRLYFDYGNIIGAQPFRLRLYLDDDLIKALGKTKVRKAFRERY